MEVLVNILLPNTIFNHMYKQIVVGKFKTPSPEKGLMMQVEILNKNISRYQRG